MLHDRIGNRASMKPKGLGTGSGAPHRKLHFGHVTLSGKAGEIKRLSADDIFNTVPDMGIFTQASVGSVIVSITLADVDLAMSPDQDSGDHWVVDHTAAPGAINQIEMLATALKLEFTSDAIIYISGA